MIRVYVAGPYTKSDPAVNTRNAVDLGSVLLDTGYTPFIPHLTHLWHLIHPRPYGEWLDYAMQWLSQCDVVFRMNGESNGADKEVQFALASGIPVVYSIAELCQKFPIIDDEGND